MTQTTPAMTSADVRLKSCPFCGGEAFIRHVEAHDHTPALKLVIPDLDAAEDTYWPECLTCGAAKDGKNTEAEAAAAWNTRHSTPAPVNVDQLREALEGARLLFANGIMVSAAKSAADAEQVAAVLDQIDAALAAANVDQMRGARVARYEAALGLIAKRGGAWAKEAREALA